MSRHTHFIGIGGIGMSGIAQLVLSRGEKVSGSDLKESSITKRLRKSGAQVFIGHHPENIKGADLIVYSSAIKEDNAEFKEARTRGIPLMRRAEALAGLMQDKAVITITGSHGKTTTTSLVSHLLLEAGFSPTVAIGGILRNIESNARIGCGKFFVAEADESDGSFLCYQPKYSIITNIDYEHLDYYRDFSNAVNAFEEFLNKTDKDGCVLACADDSNLENLLKHYQHKYVLFGFSDKAQIYPRQIKMRGLASEFDCFCR
ncbi:MAG: UDP-N-acetylmuramate--L-alanine ligase, partial [Candidatus Omnitrophica bacterium]|nr:UDP-N-acetylmuramate--L-alanine ligase [Candidatus Omnitrophota bacterium]